MCQQIVNMTNDEINIAVAESSGWYPHPENDKREQKFWTYGGGGYGLPSGCLKRRAAYPSIQDDFRGDVASLPDYCNDFNAMHEAKSTLKGDKRIEFIDYLCEVIKRDNNLSDEPYSTMTTAFYSTARQQAEAFLKTIGKLK